MERCGGWNRRKREGKRWDYNEELRMYEQWWMQKYADEYRMLRWIEISKGMMFIHIIREGMLEKARK